MVRSPIVTILGHVDHGKTTLLDYVRKSSLTQKEHGGITQSIGAYEVDTKIKGYPISKITFIDTPGHEAFSFLRARGANVSDIAILIIDAKDSVMPQTIESITHIKTAKIPYIVAINKVDLPDANPEKVKNDLLKYEVAVEGKGGTVPTVNISAKTGQGVPELLESILLLASELNLNYSPTNPVQAYIIETEKNKKGIIVSAIIKDGTLKIGDTIFTNELATKIRSLSNDLGETVREVNPSSPFTVLGFEKLPEVGSLITASSVKGQSATVLTTSEAKKFNLEAILSTKPKEKKISLIIKTNSLGSMEAIKNALSANENIEIVASTVGEISKSDVFLAKSTNSIIVGFSVPVIREVLDLAKQEKVIIKTYNIIYELLEELSEVSRLLTEKVEAEKSLKGEAKVLANFVREGETIYGVKLTKGKINLADTLEIYRDNKMIGKSKLVSLRIRAKTVAEVKKNEEAGMIISPQLDIHTGDVVKSIL